ncbi:putative tetratricopeptide-like helical domain superfamily, TRAPP II complex, TRAPPC10 [Helianthus annuus]|uniref:Putative tetratricopeptide-like helical domain-containing protein n=1 Tax=Helianthus annuus TaxID=4232 RepID=A0A251SR81_HELAN|nr:trafficking protein particle complex II-specific subunit 130 homolog [Helianthus annuus]KAF5780924.1 putative tetratricopeptide-like helical domain superfamily, TRAPP II complex, TRAPPC10 [Helianthus annuus]KAJ0500612.1 putative tetratricopeptide-like helical domain superfamily, TRAPP II complex, TRAPPC10 [Helianthus annuus]KAJ0508197.1 putative tetratricopeptide-like helical domain superfamily, TRAPP II complex, TRAPPC10 [Helianthus annuus]KAJ0516496.1 putative tetratricopeptide-like helica
MAHLLAQFQSIKISCDGLVIAVKDVSDLWPLVKEKFEERLPFKRAMLNNKNHYPVTVDNLQAEFLLTTDSRIKSRVPQDQLFFCFQEPYATVVLVACEDLDEFKTVLKPRLKLILQNEEEWFIVFVSKAKSEKDSTSKMEKKVYARLEVDFNSRRRERCCKYDLHGTVVTFWDDFELKIMECIRNTFDRRVQFYEDEIRKLNEQRLTPVWTFCNFFILKESLAFMLEMANLHEDSLREYDDLELCYMDTVKNEDKKREFGGTEHGDDQSAILSRNNKQLTQIVLETSFREFEFQQYLFACQAKLLFDLNRPFDVASRGFSFIASFSEALGRQESNLPFCTREVWILTSCLSLINATADHYRDGQIAPDLEREYYRIRAELYSQSRVKLMRLAYLIGFGSTIERSPLNSASLSMLPWPKPAVWPSVPSDASSEVLDKEKTILQVTPRIKHFGIQSKPLSLEPSSLLSDASSVDTTRLSELFVAAEHALRATISDPDLRKSLSSLEEFEKKYLDLSKGAADNYYHAWWKRHGVVFDGEIASVYFKHKNYEQAASSYEKVCALYSGDGWQDLLADVLPNLAECQKILNDKPGYLSSCVRLLSLDKNLFAVKERQAFQSELVHLAHSDMADPVPLDVSSLITYSGNSGPPVELCDGDPGTLTVTLWSEFPDDISLESLSLTLTATNNADERVKTIKSSGVTMLKTGWNTIDLSLPPQKPGSYELGVLTGQIGHLRFRSHGFSRGGPANRHADDMSFDKPAKPVLKVFKPRSLVDLYAAVSSALLMNKPQWVGIVIKPLNYSLKGARLHIDVGPGLKIEESRAIEIEKYADNDNNSSNSSNIPTEISQINLTNGSIELPDWASNITSIFWTPVCAISDGLPRGTSAGVISTQRPSIANGMRTLALKLEFGVSHNQIMKRTIPIHFTDPFHVSTRVTDQGSDGSLFLQVILQSQVKASLTIHDVWLDLQDGFSHAGRGDGRPTSGMFPLIVPPASNSGVLFGISLGATTAEDEGKAEHRDTIINIKYEICGDRNHGSHTPISLKPEGPENADVTPFLTFRSGLVLQRPVQEPLLAVAFLPLPSNGLTVGQLVTFRWRLERLTSFDLKDELLYEVNANSRNWMFAGRKRGHAPLSSKQGARIEISIMCVPLAAGHVRPPQLHLPNVNKAHICCNPAGPHLVCVLPPPLSSSFCIPA